MYNIKDYLIITLQRFDAEASQINNSVIIFESSLNLKNYLDFELFNGESYFFLKGTRNHIGNFNSGHYYCFIKIESDWYQFNDCNVEKVLKMEFSSDSAYVLIYQKEY